MRIHVITLLKVAPWLLNLSPICDALVLQEQTLQKTRWAPMRLDRAQSLNAISSCSTGFVSGEENLCMDGHLVPEFFLLGAQKAATTTFSWAFGGRNCSTEQGVVRGKFPLKFEVHFFDGRSNWDNGKEWWMSKYPNCTKTRRLVAADETPNTLIEPHAAIARLREVYGDMISRITFAVILREPLARAYSAFQFFQNNVKLDGETEGADCINSYRHDGSSGFDRYALEFLHAPGTGRAIQHKGLEDIDADSCLIFYHSNYSHFLRKYLRPRLGLSRSKFHIFTFRQIIDESYRSRAVTYMWNELGLAGNPENMIMMDANTMKTRRIEQEVPDTALLKRLKKRVDDIMGAKIVAQTLLENEVRVFDYHGPATVPGLSSWLTSTW